MSRFVELTPEDTTIGIKSPAAINQVEFALHVGNLHGYILRFPYLTSIVSQVFVARKTFVANPIGLNTSLLQLSPASQLNYMSA